MNTTMRLLTPVEAQAVVIAIATMRTVSMTPVLDLRFGHMGVSLNNHGRIRVRDYRKGANDGYGRGVYSGYKAFCQAYGVQP